MTSCDLIVCEMVNSEQDCVALRDCWTALCKIERGLWQGPKPFSWSIPFFFFFLVNTFY